MSAFTDPDTPLILSPLPVASCRSRDPVRRLLNSRQGREAFILPLPTIQKVPGFTSEQHYAMGRGESPLPRAEKKRALLLLRLSESAGFQCQVDRGINGRAPNKTASSFYLGGTRLCRESHLYTPTNKHAPGWGRVIMAARPLFPAPLPRGERRDNKGQRPLVLIHGVWGTRMLINRIKTASVLIRLISSWSVNQLLHGLLVKKPPKATYRKPTTGTDGDWDEN